MRGRRGQVPGARSGLHTALACVGKLTTHRLTLTRPSLPWAPMPDPHRCSPDQAKGHSQRPVSWLQFPLPLHPVGHASSLLAKLFGACMRNRRHPATEKRLLPSITRALEHMHASSSSRRSGRPDSPHAAPMLCARSDLGPSAFAASTYARAIAKRSGAREVDGNESIQTASATGAEGDPDLNTVPCDADGDGQVGWQGVQRGAG